MKVDILTKNMVFLVKMLKQNGLQSLPDTWMIPHEQYGDMLCLYDIGLCGNHRHPLGGILSVRKTLEGSHGLENVTGEHFLKSGE